MIDCDRFEVERVELEPTPCQLYQLREALPTSLGGTVLEEMRASATTIIIGTAGEPSIAPLREAAFAAEASREDFRNAVDDTAFVDYLGRHHTARPCVKS